MQVSTVPAYAVTLSQKINKQTKEKKEEARCGSAHL